MLQVLVAAEAAANILLKQSQTLPWFYTAGVFCGIKLSSQVSPGSSGVPFCATFAGKDYPTGGFADVAAQQLIAPGHHVV